MAPVGVGGQLRVFSYGGGTQSTAALVLASVGKIDFRDFVFANVGEKSEARTIRYVREVAMQYAAEHGLNLEEVRRTGRDGSVLELYDRVMSDRYRGVQLPMRLANGSPARRHCTRDYKIRVLAKWQREHGASRECPAIVGLGISWDELQRMRTNRDDDATVVVYPLIDLRLTRQDCVAIISAAGLPQPGRSSCFYCPYKTQSEWQRLRHEEPDLFARALEMERHMDRKMVAEGEGHCTFHSKGPLLTITSPNRQASLFDAPEDSCESGYCLT